MQRSASTGDRRRVLEYSRARGRAGFGEVQSARCRGQGQGQGQRRTSSQTAAAAGRSALDPAASPTRTQAVFPTYRYSGSRRSKSSKSCSKPRTPPWPHAAGARTVARLCEGGQLPLPRKMQPPGAVLVVCADSAHRIPHYCTMQDARACCTLRAHVACCVMHAVCCTCASHVARCVMHVACGTCAACAAR